MLFEVNIQHSGSRTGCDDRLISDAHNFYILNFPHIWYQINIIRLTLYLIWYQINIFFVSHLISDRLHSQAYIWFDIRSTSFSITSESISDRHHSSSYNDHKFLFFKPFIFKQNWKYHEIMNVHTNDK